MVDKGTATLKAPQTGSGLARYTQLLGRYLRPQLVLVSVVAVLLFANIGLQLVNPQILRYFIDEAQTDGPVGRLFTAAALFIAIALVQQVVNVLATYTSGRVGWNATNALRVDLASHCLLLDMSFHHKHTPGEMVERIDGDSNALGGFFSTFVVQVLGSALLLVGILALLYREDWRAGLVLTAFAALSFTALALLRNVSIGRWTVARQASAETYGFLEERVSGR